MKRRRRRILSISLLYAVVLSYIVPCMYSTALQVVIAYVWVPVHMNKFPEYEIKSFCLVSLR